MSRKLHEVSSLRTRFILTYAGLIVLGFTGLALLAGQQISDAAREEYRVRLDDTIKIFAQSLAPHVLSYRRGDMTRQELIDFLAQLAQHNGTRIIVYDTDFEPLADSAGAEADVGSGPELQDAAADRVTQVRRRDDLGNWMIYTAAPIEDHGDLLGLVQIKVPARHIESAVQQRWLLLGAGLFGILQLAIAAAFWLSTTLTRPLEQLRLYALRLSRGDFSERVPEEGDSEIRQLARAFNHMADQVEAMIEEQRAFASATSHELRTPLTTLRLRTEALRRGTLDSATREQYIEEIDNEMIRLSSLVEDLILLSRFDAGRAELGESRVEPTRFARSLLRDLEPQAEVKAITLDLDIAQQPLPEIDASINHLSVVFRNLIDNAIKYTPEGGQVVWRLDLQPEGEEMVLISTIQDTGQGIAADELPNVMKRFYRVDRARARSTPGTGLGLSLVRSVVEAYEGTLSIASPGIGQGTTVTVRWPARRSNLPTDPLG